MATDCCFVDDYFTHKHLYQIVSRHAAQLVSTDRGVKGKPRRRSAGGSEESIDVRAGLSFADFARALQAIGEIKMGPGKNGMHRLVYLNIIRFANLESANSDKSPAQNIVPPKARRDGLQDPLLKLVLESTHTGVTTVQTRELVDECKSKWAEIPKTGKEMHVTKKHFADIFSDVGEAFIFFDLNGNDFLTMHEFRRGLQRLKLADVNVEQVMREVDLGCKRRTGEDIDLISFIRLFAWHPVKELPDWIARYEKTKLASDNIVERIREVIRKRSTPAPSSQGVDLDLVTACSVLGTRWEEVRKYFLAMRQSIPPKNRLTPSPSRARRSKSPLPLRRSVSPQPSHHRAWSEGLRRDSRSSREHLPLNGNLADSGRAINAIGKHEFTQAMLSIPLDLNEIQVLKAFNFLNVDKQGWFHLLQAEDVLRKAGYLPRVITTKASTSNINKRSQESIMQEMMSVEYERTLALSALADQWASHELDLVNSRHKDRIKTVLTLEEQVRFDRATTSAQKALTTAMEKQFSSIHQMFDDRLKHLGIQLAPSSKPPFDPNPTGIAARISSPLLAVANVSGLRVVSTQELSVCISLAFYCMTRCT